MNLAMLQAMLAANAAAPGGGMPPNTYAGLQFWFSARDLATTFTSVNNTDPATADGDFVNRVDSKSPTTRCIAGGSIATQNNALQLAEVNGNNVIRFAHDVTDDLTLWTKPAPGAAPSVATLRTDIKAAGAGTFIFAGIVSDTTQTGASTSDVSPIVDGAGSGDWGFGFYKDGGDIKFRHYNFDGTSDQVNTAAIAPGTPVVVSVRHNSGQIRIRVNGGTFSSVASGNTSNFGSTVRVCAFGPGDLAEWMDVCGYNVALPDASLLEVERNFGAALGVTIP